MSSDKYIDAHEQADAELKARLGMDVKGQKDDPLAAAINAVIPSRVTSQPSGPDGKLRRQAIVPNIPNAKGGTPPPRGKR
jgi:hypothetical protein